MMLMTDATLNAPFEGVWRLTQGWGSNAQFYAQFRYDGVSLKGHNGLDFALPIGTAVQAVDAGKVLWVGFEPGGFGNYVKLMHSWGESLYAHLDTVPMLGMYQHIKAGEVIGRSGNTGASTGPHLHFGIRLAGYKRNNGWGGFSDPLTHIPSDCYTLGRTMGDDEDAPTGIGEEDKGRP